MATASTKFISGPAIITANLKTTASCKERDFGFNPLASPIREVWVGFFDFSLHQFLLLKNLHKAPKGNQLIE